MKPYSEDKFKHVDNLRSTTKTAKLVACNADRSKKKVVRQRVKQEINKQL